MDILSQDSTRITICKHIFCQNCIETVIQTQQKCPMCRTELSSPEKCLVAPAVKEETDDDDQEEGNSLAIWVNQVRSWMVLFIFLKVTHSLFLNFHIPLSPSTLCIVWLLTFVATREKDP